MAKREVGKEKGKSVCRWIPCFMHNIYIYHIYIKLIKTNMKVAEL